MMTRHLDGIVTLVDAAHLIMHLDEEKPEGVENEAVEQVGWTVEAWVKATTMTTSYSKTWNLKFEVLVLWVGKTKFRFFLNVQMPKGGVISKIFQAWWVGQMGGYTDPASFGEAMTRKTDQKHPERFLTILGG